MCRSDDDAWGLQTLAHAGDAERNGIAKKLQHSSH